MTISGEAITIRGEGITLSLLIARRTRSYLPGYVERVLDLNYGLADVGVFLPVGTVVVLPTATDAEVANKTEVINLWE